MPIDALEQAVQDLLLDICEVMGRQGYEAVNIGALMRLIGVGDERAAKHDAEFFQLDEEFYRLLAARQNKKSTHKKNKRIWPAESSTTIH